MRHAVRNDGEGGKTSPCPRSSPRTPRGGTRFQSVWERAGRSWLVRSPSSPSCRCGFVDWIPAQGGNDCSGWGGDVPLTPVIPDGLWRSRRTRSGLQQMVARERGLQTANKPSSGLPGRSNTEIRDLTQAQHIEIRGSQARSRLKAGTARKNPLVFGLPSTSRRALARPFLSRKRCSLTLALMFGSPFGPETCSRSALG